MQSMLNNLVCEISKNNCLVSRILAYIEYKKTLISQGVTRSPGQHPYRKEILDLVSDINPECKENIGTKIVYLVECEITRMKESQ